MRLLTAVLINFNCMEDLEPCLQSLAAQDYPDIELVIVDNASTDGSLEWLRGYTSRPDNATAFAGGPPRLVENPCNLGFSPALNQGVAAAGGELVMPLNPDMVMDSGFVSALVAAMDQPGAGSATGKLLRFPVGGMDNPIDSAGHVIFRNRLAENRGEGLPAGSLDEGGPVFGTCGAAAVYSRAMLDDVAVGGEYFDEDFFAFWEDLDLDWRANLRGWRCVYEPAALAWHRRGGAGYRKSLLVERHNYKNRYLTMLKNDSAARVIANLPGILLTELLKGGALLVRCPAALGAWLDVVRLTPRMLAKRRVIQARRLVPPGEIERWFEPFHYRRWIRRHLLDRGEMIAEGGEARR